MEERPVAGNVAIYQQPLGDRDSVATFDVVLRNFGDRPSSLSSVDLQLSGDDDSCRGPAGAGTVDDIVVINVDQSLSVSGGNTPVWNQVKAWQPISGRPECLRVTVPVTYDIVSDGAIRLRFDVRSPHIRSELNRRDLGRFDDFRLYKVKGTFTIESANPQYPRGTLSVVSKMSPGDYPQDKATIGSVAAK